VRSIKTVQDAGRWGDEPRSQQVRRRAGSARIEFRRAKAAVIEAFERSFLERALTDSRGNVSAAARLIGKERRAFGKLMKKHGLSRRSLSRPRVNRARPLPVRRTRVIRDPGGSS